MIDAIMDDNHSYSYKAQLLRVQRAKELLNLAVAELTIADGYEAAWGDAEFTDYRELAASVEALGQQATALCSSIVPMVEMQELASTVKAG